MDVILDVYIMWIAEPKRNQKIILRDTISGAEVTIKTFRRECGNYAVGIDAPRTVKITREKDVSEQGCTTKGDNNG